MMHPTINLNGICSKELIIKFPIKNNFHLDKPIEEIIHLGESLVNTIHPSIFFDIDKNSSLTLIENFKTNSGLITPLQYINLRRKCRF